MGIEPLPFPDYTENPICPFHHCYTERGWCWECAEETYGYEKAKEIYEKEKIQWQKV